MAEPLAPGSLAEPTAARLRQQAAIASVAVAVVLMLSKLGAWFATDSVSVLSSLLDSTTDIAASGVTLYSIRQAVRPPDRSHRFGHGKAEPLGALAQAAFIAGSAVIVVFQAVDRLIVTKPVETAEAGIAVMVLAIVATLALVLFQRSVIRRTGSLAIGADSLNYQGDLLTASAVLATLVATDRLGLAWLDPLIGAAIALFLLANAYRIIRRALDLLMDRELPGEERARIGGILAAHEGVRGYHDLRTRSSGTTRFIEVHLEMDGAMTLDRVHDIVDEVEADLARAFPDAEMIIHQEPAGLDDSRLDHRIACRR